ncbi:unnamed protein product [Cylicocyclus nassatus]|uniref:Uncharacterized protein n=1 Tax=Cylicocyclus nassatus TaxID=53992 RepID=A0AA36GR79_CYLNA|nr:unnamed protein product [Cylicocyclus nassatus]
MEFVISDALRGDDSSPGAHFNSLLTSLYLADSSLLISAILFFCAAYTFAKDHRKFRRLMGVLDESSKSEKSDAPRYDQRQLAEQKLVSH